MTTITFDPNAVLQVLDERGWTQLRYESDITGAVCLHGAIRLCSPVPGDAHLIEQVAERNGWGPTWNDARDRTEADVRSLLRSGLEVTNTDLAETFGPQWRAVVALVRRAVVLTGAEADRLGAAGAAARSAARAAAWAAAWAAARAAAWAAAWAAARAAARAAAWAAAWAAAGAAAGAAAWAAAAGAAAVVAVWDLASDDGPFTPAHRDLLVAPWVEVIGPIEELVEVDR